MTTKRIAVFAMALGCLMLPLTASSQGFSPDPNLRIVFASDRGGPEGPIYMMNVDGTEIHLLPINDGRNIGPACSPEGSYLAFYSEIGLQVADANFTDVQTVVSRASTDGGFSLSANAGKLAFVLLEADNRDIYVSNRDGTGLTRLTTHPAFDVSPALSPDGTKVVFASNRGEQHNNYELYVINVDGSNLTQLTNTGGSNDFPRWSPDGTRIAFTSDQAGNGSSNIYVMNPDGSNPIPLTNSSAANYQPAWSPDGTQIAFVTDRDGNMEIYVMNADGTNPTRVTHYSYFDDQPCWLTVSPPTMPKLDLFLPALDAGTVPTEREVVEGGAQNEDSPINAVAWSPDSARYVTGDYDGYVKIWNAATGQRLQSFPAPDFNLSFPPLITSISWNPDGNRLAITASASTQPSAYLWVLDLTTGQTTEFDAESLTSTATWNPDGTLLAAGVTRGNASYGEHWIKVWDVASQQLVASLEGYSDLIFSVAWSPDGTRLASCSADATAVIWDTTTWTRLLTLGEWPTQAALWGSWSPDGTRLATTSVNGTAGIWDTVTGQLLMILYSDDNEPLYEIVWHPDGTQLAGVSEHAVKLWDAATGVQIGKLETTERLNTLAWSPDSTQILLGGVGLRHPLTVDPATLTTPNAIPTPTELLTPSSA